MAPLAVRPRTGGWRLCRPQGLQPRSVPRGAELPATPATGGGRGTYRLDAMSTGTVLAESWKMDDFGSLLYEWSLLTTDGLTWR